MCIKLELIGMDYSIAGIVFKKACQLKVICNSKLNFSTHYNFVASKAFNSVMILYTSFFPQNFSIRLSLWFLHLLAIILLLAKLLMEL